jgi:hypothetical protein
VTQAPHVEHDEVVEKLRRTPEHYDEIREPDSYTHQTLPTN